METIWSRRMGLYERTNEKKSRLADQSEALPSFSSVGLFVSLLSLATVWQKALKKKESFYRWIFLIACLDFFYNFTFVWLTLPDDVPFKSLNTQTYTNAMIWVILKGIAPGCSFASDLFTLCLTVERFLKLQELTTGTVDQTKMLVTVIELIGVFIVASTRGVIMDVQ